MARKEAEAMLCVAVTAFAPTLSQHDLLLHFEQRQSTDFFEIPGGN
jgi:hypothetical protein